jgi:hypothetical protein
METAVASQIATLFRHRNEDWTSPATSSLERFGQSQPVNLTDCPNLLGSERHSSSNKEGSRAISSTHSYDWHRLWRISTLA